MLSKGHAAPLLYAVLSKAAYFEREKLWTLRQVNSREMALEPFAEKWRAFGWHVETADGHDIGAGLADCGFVPFITSMSAFLLTNGYDQLRVSIAIVTAEEYLLHGGMGSNVVRIVAAAHPVPMRFVGMPDTYTDSGEPEELLEKYGMTAQDIVLAAREAVAAKP